MCQLGSPTVPPVRLAVSPFINAKGQQPASPPAVHARLGAFRLQETPAARFVRQGALQTAPGRKNATHALL